MKGGITQESLVNQFTIVQNDSCRMLKDGDWNLDMMDGWKRLSY